MSPLHYARSGHGGHATAAADARSGHGGRDGSAVPPARRAPASKPRARERAPASEPPTACVARTPSAERRHPTASRPSSYRELCSGPAWRGTPQRSGDTVGLARIELATSSLSGMRSNRLSYSPVPEAVHASGPDPRSASRQAARGPVSSRARAEACLPSTTTDTSTSSPTRVKAVSSAPLRAASSRAADSPSCAPAERRRIGCGARSCPVGDRTTDACHDQQRHRHHHDQRDAAPVTRPGRASLASWTCPNPPYAPTPRY